jgi:hypothetical protein
LLLQLGLLLLDSSYEITSTKYQAGSSHQAPKSTAEGPDEAAAEANQQRKQPLGSKCIALAAFCL